MKKRIETVEVPATTEEKVLYGLKMAILKRKTRVEENFQIDLDEEWFRATLAEQGIKLPASAEFSVSREDAPAEVYIRWTKTSTETEECVRFADGTIP